MQGMATSAKRSVQEAHAEAFINTVFVRRSMAKKSEGPGIQSAAGLIRYFDAEEKSAFKIAPIAVIIFGSVVGVGVLLLRALVEF